LAPYQCSYSSEEERGVPGVEEWVFRYRLSSNSREKELQGANARAARQVSMLCLISSDTIDSTSRCGVYGRKDWSCHFTDYRQA